MIICGGVVELSNLAVAINSMGSDLVRSRDALVESGTGPATGSYGGGGAHAHDVNLGVKYLDMIIASKD